MIVRKSGDSELGEPNERAWRDGYKIVCNECDEIKAANINEKAITRNQ